MSDLKTEWIRKKLREVRPGMTMDEFRALSVRLEVEWEEHLKGLEAAAAAGAGAAAGAVEKEEVDAKQDGEAEAADGDVCDVAGSEEGTGEVPGEEGCGGVRES